jgi:hypothetical protein
MYFQRSCFLHIHEPSLSLGITNADSPIFYSADMPAIWMLNAQIPRTLQYGNAECSCWASGCGEFDIAEALSSGSVYLKSTLHTNTPGGDSDYLLRPTSETMKLAVIFSSSDASAHIQYVFCEPLSPISMRAQGLGAYSTHHDVGLAPRELSQNSNIRLHKRT